MNIAFDASPLISTHITGIGWCEAEQTMAMARLHPENKYTYHIFSRKDDYIKIARIAPFAGKNIDTKIVNFSGYIYRTLSALIPVPYNYFFGNEDNITNFFNYIVPPGVHGKTVVTVHDMVYKAFPKIVRWRTKHMLNIGLNQSMKRADIIVTDSEFSKSEIIKYFPEYKKKIKVVPCGVNLAKFKPCENLECISKVKKSLKIEGTYFLYVGTIEPRKNLERLINAYYGFTRRIPKAPKLVIVGGKGWLYNKIFKRTIDLKLTKQVIFTNYVPAEYLNPLMCGSIAFVFPSIYEGFGLPLLEAMASGVPILCSNAASLPEVTGDCAVLCDPYSEDSITNNMIKIYFDEKLRKDLIRRGLERVRNFTWDKSAEKLYNIYKEM